MNAVTWTVTSSFYQNTLSSSHMSNNINGNAGEQCVFLESTPLTADCVWWWSGTWEDLLEKG